MLNNLFTEILSKSEWKNKKPEKGDPPLRKKVISNIDFKKYKENLKELKKIFTKLNNGKFKSTLIFDYEKIKTKEHRKALNAHDLTLIDVLKRLDYEVSEESYMLGFANKNKKAVLIKDIINTLKSKKIDSMQAAYEKTGNASIKKQIDALEVFNEINLNSTMVMAISKENKYKIVLSIQPMLIASQSTKVGWTSCMDLYKGFLNDRVGKGIADGVIIAYLVKTGDEKILNSPVARMLLNRLRNEETKETIYAYDKAYGTPPKGFENKVIEIIKMTGKYVFGKEVKPGFYEIDPWSSYIDPELSDILDPAPEEIDQIGITIFSKEEKQLLSAIKSGDFSMDQIRKEVLKTSDSFKSYIVLTGDLDYPSLEKVILTINNPTTSLIMSLNELDLEQKVINKVIENYVTSTKNISAKKLAKMISTYSKNNISNINKLKKLENIGIPITKELIVELVMELVSEDYRECMEIVKTYKNLFKTVADWIKIIDASLMDYSGLLEIYEHVPRKLILEVIIESLDLIQQYDITKKVFLNRVFNYLGKSDIKTIYNDLIENKEKSKYYDFRYRSDFLYELTDNQVDKLDSLDDE